MYFMWPVKLKIAQQAMVMWLHIFSWQGPLLAWISPDYFESLLLPQ